MRRTNAKIIGGVLVLAIILVGIAYAAITNTELNISGTGKAEGRQSNFVVEFIGTPTTSGDGTTVNLHFVDIDKRGIGSDVIVITGPQISSGNRLQTGMKWILMNISEYRLKIFHVIYRFTFISVLK